MNCTEHPDEVVNSHCDVCHKPFCPSCLQDDRGRFVCKRCFDPANQPGELAGNNPHLPVVPDEKTITLKRARKGFWYSKTGSVIFWAGFGLLMVAGIHNTYYDVAYPRHDEHYMRVVDVVVDIIKLLTVLGLYVMCRLSVNAEPPNVKQPRPFPLPVGKILLVVSPVILLLIYLCWLVFRI